jgi:hypothetical protein
LGVPVTQIKLGNFDFSYFHSKNQLQTIQSQRAETLTWPEGTREVYGKNFLSSVERGIGSYRGSPLRELHNAVFDAMAKTGRRGGGVIRVGQGSRMYGFVGTWVPRGLVGWMMGMRRAEKQAQHRSESPNGSGNSSDGDVYTSITADSDYVAVSP